MPSNDHNPVSILLIDDDELSRELLTLLLSAEGYDVEAMDSGDAALRHLQQTPRKPPQVILSDLQMPGITGPELAQKLRAACASQRAPRPLLLAISGSRPDDATRNSFDGFLLKPFTMQDLATALTTQTQHSGSTVPTESPSPLPSVSLNEDTYRKLTDSIPGEQLNQLYALCLSDIEARTARMRTAATSGDDACYRREAHAIKGGAGMVGATEIHRLATDMEQQGLDTANHVASLDEMLLSCERLRVILIAR